MIGFNAFQWIFSGIGVTILTVIVKNRHWFTNQTWLNLIANLLIITSIITSSVFISNKFEIVITELESIKNTASVLIEGEMYKIKEKEVMILLEASDLSSKRMSKHMDIILNNANKIHNDNILRNHAIRNMLLTFYNYMKRLGISKSNMQQIMSLTELYCQKNCDKILTKQDKKMFNEKWETIINNANEDSEDIDLVNYLSACPFAIYKRISNNEERIGVAFPNITLKIERNLNYKVVSIGNPKRVLNLKDSMILMQKRSTKLSNEVRNQFLQNHAVQIKKALKINKRHIKNQFKDTTSS